MKRARGVGYRRDPHFLCGRLLVILKFDSQVASGLRHNRAIFVLLQDGRQPDRTNWRIRSIATHRIAEMI